MTESRAKRWLYLALMLAASLPLFAMIVLLALYVAPEMVLGWPWTDGLAAIVGPLTLIVGPLLVLKPLAHFAGARRRYLVALLLTSVVLAAAFIPASLYLHTRLGTPAPISACDEYFADTMRCIGRDWSMLQGRLRFARGQGVPRRELCEAFLNAPPAATDENECDLTKPALWSMADCAQYGAPSDWHCRVCDRQTPSNDTYRTFVGFERSCGRARIIETANMPLSGA